MNGTMNITKEKKMKQSPEGWLSTNGIMVRTINNKHYIRQHAWHLKIPEQL
jgi:hypothetical protein